MASGPIVIIGSINMDLVCRTPRMPRPGETVIGSDFITVPGGKGANQAVAVAKLGGRAHMVGRVGEDDFGERLLNGLRNHGVNTDHVTVTEGVASGVAMILVDRKGENSIVVAAGANGHVSPADVDAAEALIASASVVVMQLEVPYETVRHAIGLCQRHGVFAILDPAPAPTKALPRAMYGVDVFTPNEHEAAALAQTVRRGPSRNRKRKLPDAKQMGSEMLARGARAVVLKLGAKGAMVVSGDGKIARVRPFKVKPVDTTAAGDAFTGALAVALSEGRDVEDAVRLANAAGALCCTGFGAQPAIPDRAAVDRLLAGAT